MNWPGLSSLPETLSFWWLLLPFIVWVCFSCVHLETMRRLRSGRAVFGQLVLHKDVPLFLKNGKALTSADILSVDIRNVPYDSQSGRTIDKAFGIVEVYDEDFKRVMGFEYPRWADNQKPGYQGSPSDHFPHEWNFRDLHPNGSKNRMDIFIKESVSSSVGVLRGVTQIMELWRDKEFQLPPGTYKVLLRLRGHGLASPANLWFALVNAGKDVTMQFSQIETNAFCQCNKRMKQLEKMEY